MTEPPTHSTGRAQRAAAAAGWAARTAACALDLLFPNSCRECRRPLDGAAPLCASCAGTIPWIRSRCLRCGEPLPGPGAGDCGSCSGRALHFDAAAAPAEYSGPWRRVLLLFKYSGDRGVQRTIAGALQDLFASRFLPSRPEAIIPVPPHPWHRWMRGRDAVDELASSLARGLDLPVLRILRRAWWARSQTSLPRDRRLVNPKGAYRIRRGGRPACVVLLDDVYTTGATASECARVLKLSGVRTVLALAAARSPRDP